MNKNIIRLNRSLFILIFIEVLIKAAFIIFKRLLREVFEVIVNAGASFLHIMCWVIFITHRGFFIVSRIQLAYLFIAATMTLPWGKLEFKPHFSLF